LFLVPALSAPVPYTAPSGDLDKDGLVNVADIQCQVLVHARVTAAGTPGEDLCATDAQCLADPGPGYYCRAGFSGYKICLPTCLDESVMLGEALPVDCAGNGDDFEDADCLGKVQKHNADLNCDGEIGNEDFAFLIAVMVGKLGGAGSADHDGDARLNFCDNDSDGDSADDPADCAPLNALVGACDDGDACTDDSCVDGECLNVSLEVGAGCDDGDPCTLGDTCEGGFCLGTPLVCEDSNPCTNDSCQGGQCVFAQIEGCNNCPGGCDDGDPCTSDSCQGSSCSHSAIWGCTTCAGACGGQSKYGCWCDEACFEFGLDCCMDVCEHCEYCAGKECGIDLCGNWCGWCPWPKECWAGGMCI